MIDVAPQELALVQEILRAHVSGARVWAFGSRIKGTTRRGSDLDLAIDTGAPLPLSVKSRLADAFDVAPLPYNVDLVDLQDISEEFRKHVDAHKVPLPGFGA